jgi:hypothetical protein
MGHAYWLGKKKLGRVSLFDRRYSWEAGTRAGITESLKKAKAAVEAAVETAERQLDLFA